MLPALQTKNTELVDSLLSLDYQLRFYVSSELHATLVALEEFNETSHEAVLSIRIMRVVSSNDALTAEFAQLGGKVLLGLIKKYESDKVVIVESVSVLRQLLLRYPQAVFATLRQELEDASNTLCIALAAVVPEVLNEIDSPEAVNFMQIVKNRLSEQDFLSPVTNGVLSLVDCGEIQFLQMQTYFDRQISNFVKRMNTVSRTYERPTYYTFKPINFQAVELSGSLLQLVNFYVESARGGNQESLQIIAAAAYFDSFREDAFFKTLSTLVRPEMDFQIYDSCLEILSYYLLKSTEIKQETPQNAFRVFSELLKNDCAANCQISSQLHIARSFCALLKCQTSMNERFVADCLGYLEKAAQNLNLSKDIVAFKSIRAQLATETSTPCLVHQILAAMPSPVESKVQRLLFFEILMAADQLDAHIDREVLLPALEDLMFEFKICCPISIFRLITGRISEKYANCSVLLRNLALTGAYDPEWRCRLACYQWMQLHLLETYCSDVQRDHFPFWEAGRVVIDPVMQGNPNILKQLSDPVNAVRDQAIFFLRERLEEVFKVQEGVNFLQYLSRNSNEFVICENDVFRPSDAVLDAASLAVASGTSCLLLREGTYEMTITAHDVSIISKELLSCSEAVFECAIDVGGSGELKRKRANMETLMRELG